MAAAYPIQCSRTFSNGRCRNLTFWRLIAALFLVWASRSLAAQEWPLNGIAAYSQLSKEYYIVALYTPVSITEVEPLLDSRNPKRVELRLTARQWTPFSFSEIWKRDLAINNELSAEAPSINALLSFTSFPKSELITGDLIVIDYRPGEGTRITFNGDELMDVKGSDLVNYLLRIWVGPSPPSREFKASMLAGHGAAADQGKGLLDRLARLQIADDRGDLLARWEKTETRAQREREAAERKRIAAARAEAERKAAAEAARKQAEKDAQARAAAAAVAKKQAESRARQVAAEAAAARKRAEARARRLAEVEKQKQRAAELKAEREAAEKARLEAQRAEAEAKRAEEEARRQAEAQALAEAKARELEEKRFRILGFEYDQALYAWRVQRKISTQVTYPAWARQFGEEGQVQAEVVLAADGSVEAVENIEPSAESLLAKELVAAIQRAAPFDALPEPPAEHEEQAQRRIPVSYTFRLRGGADNSLSSRPAMPADLQQWRAARISPEEREKRLEKYRSDVESQIRAEITYPHWAKNLKQTGKVVVDVIVTADGAVDRVELVDRSRHDLLNKEMEAAPVRAAPFEPIAAELGVDRVTLRIEHRFRR